MMTQSHTTPRSLAAAGGTCLGCKDCGGTCREVLDLLAVPKMVLKSADRAA